MSDEQRVAKLLLADPVLRALGVGPCSRLAESVERIRLGRGEGMDATAGAILILEGSAHRIDDEDERFLPGDVCFLEQLLDGEPTDSEPGIVADGPLRAARLSRAVLETEAASDPRLARALGVLREPSLRAFLHELARLVPTDASVIATLAASLTRRAFTTGEVLARKGETTDTFHLLVSGRARREPFGAGGSPRLLKAGDYFGEAGVALNASEPADIVALAPGAQLVLDRSLSPDGFAPLFTAFVAALADRGRHTRPVVRPRASEEHTDEEALDDQLLQPSGSALGRLWRRALRRYPVRFQPEATDCGPACLGMVTDFYGRKLSHARLRELACVSREGCSLYSLAEAAEDVGFHARGVQAENAADLRSIRLPAIAHVGTNHFVVIYSVRRRHVLIADPAKGLTRMRLRDFMKDWEGTLLLVRPGAPQEPDDADRPRGLSRFLRYITGQRTSLVEVLIASVALQLLALVIPFTTQTVIDRVFVHGEVSLLFALLGAMVGAAAFGALIEALRTLLMYDVVRTADRALVSDFHHRLFQLPLQFFASRKLGDLLIRFTDNEKVRHFLTSVATGAILDVALGALYFVVLLLYDVQLALIGLAPIPLLAILTWIVTPRMRRVQRELVSRHGEAQSALVESLSAVVTVKGTTAEHVERRRYERLFDRLLDSELRGVRLATLSHTVGRFVGGCGQAAVIFWGARLVVEGRLSVGSYVAFSAVLTQVLAPAIRLLQLWEEFQDTAVSLERLNQVFDATPDEPPDQQLVELRSIEGHVRLDNVTFRYERDLAPVFEDLSLEILPGERVAIVGRSGSGKTTLVHLLLKLYQPERGSVSLDGHDLRHVAGRSLRRQIGFVPQRIDLFSGSIADNISVGRELSIEEIAEAARAAGVHEAIEARPHGYATLVGERGTARFSGGELQRLAIARALAGKPPLLILDEPTSALDMESEAAVLRAIEERDGRTVILLAHRLGFARRADRVVVLDRGRVAEQGTHEDLLARDGLYAAFHKEQTG